MLGRVPYKVSRKIQPAARLSPPTSSFYSSPASSGLLIADNKKLLVNKLVSLRNVDRLSFELETQSSLYKTPESEKFTAKTSNIRELSS